jgi:uncharacterized protein (TIGR00369 family)
MAGLTKLMQWVAGEIPLPSMFETMNMLPVHFEDGLAHFAVTPDESHLNTTDRVHGGYMATVMDTVAGCAVQASIPDGASAATIDLQTKFLSSPEVGKTYQAEGHIIAISRTIATAEGKMFDDDGNLVAWGSGTFRVFR